MTGLKFLFLFLIAIQIACDSQALVENSIKKEEQLAEYIVDLYEDKDGNIWMGTMTKGAIKYNGDSLQYFTTEDGLPENTIVSILQDLDGNMWFGTHQGISKFDGNSFLKIEGSEGAGANLRIDSKGTIWAGTNKGAFQYNGDKFVPFEIPIPHLDTLFYKWEAGKIWDLKEDSKGNMWFARDGYGLTKYDGKAFTHYLKKDGLCSNNASQIIEDKDGNIWVACLSSDLPYYKNEGGLNKLEGEKILSFKDKPGLFHSDIYSLYRDKSDNIWVGAIDNGAYKIHSNQFEFFNESDRPDLIERFAIQSILESKDGTFWFGFSGGLFKFENGKFWNMTKEKMASKF
jgi:ligand-binding sensor domain-containing protein